jgi:uncharacterized protein YjgD (DUF1641 family)
MAEPISLHPPPRDPREALYRKLENAPQEHAEALLALLDVLQGLHDRVVLELCKGALGSSDKLLQILVETGNSPEVIRGIRNVAVLAKLADSIEPELLEQLAVAAPKALAEAQKPPGFFELLKRLMSADARRALAASVSLLEAFGNALGSRKP